ncbi:MAG: DUF6132 family protein [Firmicutes bacterium]|nr:DUF6132 family protein [Bacillota bacterium]
MLRVQLVTLELVKRIALGLAIGGGLGAVYQKLVGCRTGACPLLATPIRAILYGAALGLVWALTGRRS